MNEFISILAHELRNPLAPVKSTLELLGLQETDPEKKELIQAAHNQVHVMRRLLDDLLDISRITQGKFSLQKEKTNVCNMLRVAIETATPMMEEKDHQFVHSNSCDDTLWIDADPIRLEQVLVNLLNNAAKYTRPRGFIHLHHEIKEDVLEISVTDNGIGLSSDHLERVFEPFWQKKTNPRVSGGIGVGLTLSHEIMLLHGGTLVAKSDGPNLGSTFICRLPIRRDINTPDGAKPKLVKDGIDNFNILVVDDNIPAAESMQRLLTLRGNKAERVHTGTGAVELIRRISPEIVLLDLGLPDITGDEVARRVRAAGFKGIIIALTGYGQEEDIARSQKAGCDAHLVKPVAIADLEETIERLTLTNGKHGNTMNT